MHLLYSLKTRIICIWLAFEWNDTGVPYSGNWERVVYEENHVKNKITEGKATEKAQTKKEH